ncbi:hypothetical protein ABZT17_42855 [Streptomyces sp. NPDC005648]|uniref:hypothetical protein n=1 Tax=Streptomyces sp. NPDC005648 TaxID=3157044 RepID=UPI0033BB6FFD
MSMTVRSRWARSRRALAATAGLAAALTVGGVVTAAPASAGTHCSSGYHCVFWSTFNSARHSYFNSDNNFTNDTFNSTTYGTAGSGSTVNDNVGYASNSSTGSYYSRYYLDIGYSGGMVFCVAPGGDADAIIGGSVSSLSLTTSNPGGCWDD